MSNNFDVYHWNNYSMCLFNLLSGWFPWGGSKVSQDLIHASRHLASLYGINTRLLNPGRLHHCVLFLNLQLLALFQTCIYYNTSCYAWLQCASGISFSLRKTQKNSRGYYLPFIIYYSVRHTSFCRLFLSFSECGKPQKPYRSPSYNSAVCNSKAWRNDQIYSLILLCLAMHLAA